MRNDAIAIFVLAMFVAACGDDDPPAAGPPANLRPLSIRVDGPTEVTLPADVRFTALQTWSDGSTRDVTLSAQWTSSNPAVLAVSAGFAMALVAGEVGVTAQMDQVTSQPRSIRVLPPTQEWNGVYTLTIGGGACNESLPLPFAVRQRTYTVSLQQLGLSLTGSVDKVGGFGGQILNPQVRFTFPSAFIAASRVQRAAASETLAADIRQVSYRRVAFYPSQIGFIERLPDANRLVVTGEAITTMSASGFTGTLNGALSLYGSFGNTLLGVCASSSHGFSLVRR